MSKLYHVALIKAYMQPDTTDIQESVAHDTSDAQYASKHQISNKKKTCKPAINDEIAADSSNLSKYTYIHTYILYIQAGFTICKRLSVASRSTNSNCKWSTRRDVRRTRRSLRDASK